MRRLFGLMGVLGVLTVLWTTFLGGAPVAVADPGATSGPESSAAQEKSTDPRHDRAAATPSPAGATPSPTGPAPERDFGDRGADKLRTSPSWSHPEGKDSSKQGATSSRPPTSNDEGTKASSSKDAPVDDVAALSVDKSSADAPPTTRTPRAGTPESTSVAPAASTPDQDVAVPKPSSAVGAEKVSAAVVVTKSSTPTLQSASSTTTIANNAQTPSPEQRTSSAQSVAAKAATTVAEITAAPTAQRSPTLLNVLGSIALNLLTGAIQFFTGPPVLPSGSSVTVKTSTLVLPIGSGETVTADWYFPATVDSSTRLIYLQHGFLAAGAMYSYTAANLAESTNSIVVAPSLTSNFLDPNADWLDGAPMAQAVADLFVGNRQALTDSASAAAGYDLTLPARFVLVGHSGGGTLVGAAAGDMVDNGAIANLAGVVLLDAVDPDGSNQIANALTKLSGANDKPVLLLSSEPYFWNRDANIAQVLQAARPDTFNGLEIVGGRHIDYLQGGNPLIQLSEYLTAGFSEPQNIDAAQSISAGWINDMFDGTHTGVYGQAGQQISVPTAAGTATVNVLPIAPSEPSPIDAILNAAFNFVANNFFVYTPLDD